jgi:ABC-type nitrate/sulfonate/bicarbonate transport system substrate-binding protein
MDRRQFLAAGLATAMAGLSGCGGGRGGKQAVNFHIDWTPGVDYIGFFIARELGRFADAGYDASIVPGSGAEPAALSLGKGAIGIGTTTIDAYLSALRAGVFSAGRVPKVAAVIFQKNPVVLLSSTARPIVDARNLVGRKIGFSEETSVTFRQLQLLVSKQLPGIRVKKTLYDDALTVGPNEVALVEVGYDGPRRLMAGKLDTLVAYATDAPVELKRERFDYQQRFMSDFGLKMAGMCVCTTPRLGGRDTALALVKAACQGWDDTRNDPEGAVKKFIALYPEARLEDARFSLQQTLPLLPQTTGFEAYGAPKVIQDALLQSNEVLDAATGKSFKLDLAGSML